MNMLTVVLILEGQSRDTTYGYRYKYNVIKKLQ